jgi:two-component system, NtrC family, response regulator AtoC
MAHPLQIPAAGNRKWGKRFDPQGEDSHMLDPLLGLCTSAKMLPIRDLVAKVAVTNTTVLLRGESGVGKEVVAKAIHKASPRAGKQFLKVNCAALPSELLESELFGHEKGAFTGAYRQKPGKFEAADQGTLLLDEIGEMPLRLQAKLLHVLQDGEFSRVGGEKVIDTDVRLICATNRDLEASMRSHQFREDLYYRINVIEIRIPPLRERREEIPVLLDHFLKKFNAQYSRSVEVPAETQRAFLEYHWPGNIRELENAVKRVVVLGSARPVHLEIVGNLSRGLRPVPVPGASPEVRPSLDTPISLKDIARQAARDAERVAIKEVLDRVRWNRAKAARLLQISYKALLYKIVQCGLVSRDGDQEEKPKEVMIAS